MTRIALFADLHANLPALEAILQKIDLLDVDRIISLGDTIAIGPHPGECLEIIRRRNIECVMGNHEEYQVKQVSSAEHPPSMSDGEIAHQRWTGEQLDDGDRAFLKSLPYRMEEEIEGLRCLFLHSPHVRTDDGYTAFRNLNRETLAEWEELEIPSSVICFGHSHKPVDYAGARLYINPGSVGCHREASARFSLLEIEGKQIIPSHFEMPYDKEKVIRDLEDRKVPDRELIGKFFF